MTSEQRENCHFIIHAASASAAAVGGGLAQIPLADHLVITPIQIAMVISLGAVFSKEITDSAAKGFILGMVGSYLGRSASQILFGWIPVLGNTINAATAAGLTEAIGWAVVKKFDEGTM